MAKNRSRQVIILSAINPTRAYSCIKYLAETLLRKGINVECWSQVPVGNIAEYKKWNSDTFSYEESVWGRIPKIRTYYKKLMGLYRAYVYRNKTIICHDLFHYKACLIVKKMFPKTKLILYFTEIYNDKHSAFMQRMQRFFLSHNNEMDYMIECDFFREKYRKNLNGVIKESNTILNTIPKSEVSEYIKFPKKINSIPKIVYSGGLHVSGELDIIVDALSMIKENFEMNFICYGKDSAIEDLREKCEKYLHGKYKIITNLPRTEVYYLIRDMDIGIVYYDPEYSINTLYAAPTKFYEYVALNIPVVCAKNESLEYLINKYQLGAVMQKNNVGGLRDAIKILLCDSYKRVKISQNESFAFEKHLCYDEQSKEAIAKIISLINV